MPQEVEMATGMFNANSTEFQMTSIIALGLLGTCILLGTLWEVYRRQELKKRRKQNPGKIFFTQGVIFK